MRFIRQILIMFALFGVFSTGHTFVVEHANHIRINDVSFDLNLFADTRIAEYTYQPIEFSVLSSSNRSGATITYSSDQMDVIVHVNPRDQYASPAWLISVTATCKQELYLHDVYLSMDNASHNIIADLKGPEAIHSGNISLNRNMIPYTNKAVEYSNAQGRFWIVASNYAECDGVEALSANRVALYDYRGHFFRKYVQGGTWELMRDAMYKPAGSTHNWSFLVFGEKPIMPDFNRWPGDNRAALCITNDADSENLKRLKAVYEGSSNSASPKYYSMGFFARNIPVSNTVFGMNQNTLGEMWTTIMNNGNTIGYHTYAGALDPPGSNQQALLNDLLPYNIRLWIDHAVPNNPEDVCYDGLNPESSSYVGDIINESTIDYIWPGDTAYTNPFDAYDETWRLPHIVYEAKCFTRPIYFFGRTRTEYWDYPHYIEQLSMKYLMTAENLDRLLDNRGLHISYTHFATANSSFYGSYYDALPNGDYEIKDEVDDMLLMLDYYRNNRGLWIDTLESIFDRMLAIEKVRVVSCRKVDDNTYLIGIQNGSDRDIHDLSFKYHDEAYYADLHSRGGIQYHYVADNTGSVTPIPDYFQMRYKNGCLVLKNKYSLKMTPMSIDIYNVRGQKVQSFVTTDNQYVWTQPFDNRASGVYFARINSSNVKTSTIKFIVLK